MKKDLIIFGLGRLAAEILDFVQRYDLYHVKGFTVDKKWWIPSFLNYPVYPSEELEQYADQEATHLFIAISWYNYLNKHKKLKFDALKHRGWHFANLISPLANVKSVIFGEGNWVHDFASIGYNTTVGDNNTFLVQTMIGHHTEVGSHNVFSGRACVAGDVKIGNQNYIGLSSIIFNRVNLGDMCIIGGGAIAKNSLPNYSIITAPPSHLKHGNAKLNEFIISPRGAELSSDM